MVVEYEELGARLEVVVVVVEVVNGVVEVGLDPCADEEELILLRLELRVRCSRFMQLTVKRRSENKRRQVKSIFLLFSTYNGF